MTWLQISPINELRFVTKDVPLNALYNYSQFDRVWAYNQLKPFQKKDLYKYRKQKNDKNCIQINTNISFPRIEVREIITGAILTTINPSSFADIPGMEYNGEPLRTHQWLFRLEDVLPSFTGTCFYVLTGADPGTLEVVYYPSEPIWVKEKWEQTILLEWSHDKNDYDIIFSMNPQFSGRFDGYLEYQETDSIDTQFDDQNYSTITLNSETRRKFSLEFGMYKGIPKYLLDRLSNFFKCRYIKVDGWKYTKDEGAKLEFEQSQTATLFNASIVLQEAVPVDSYTFRVSNELTILSLSGLPKMILVLGLNKNPGLVNFVTFTEPVVIDDLTDAQNLVSEWNNELLQNGLNGTFSIKNNSIIYIPDYYENITPVVTTLDKFFSINFNLTGAAATITQQISSNGYKFGVDWGDGTNSYDAGTLQNISHTFDNEGVESRVVRLFHADNILAYVLANSVYTAKLISLGGTMSANLKTFNLSFLDSSVVTLNLGLLQVTKSDLELLQVTDSSVQTIGNPFILETPDPDAFKFLDLIDFSNNELTVATIEDFVTDFVDNANYVFNGINRTITMDNQTPSAPPNPATAADIIVLQGAGWTTNFD